MKYDTQVLPAVKSRWDWRSDLRTFFLAVLVGAPGAIGTGYIAAEWTRPTVPTPAQFSVPDIIITVEPTETRVETQVETETVMTNPPPRPSVPIQQRTRSRHAKPEPTTTVLPNPVTTTPAPTTTTPPVTSSSPVESRTPVYDQTRRTFVEDDPTAESTLPE